MENLEERSVPSASPLAPQFTIAAQVGFEAAPPAVAVVDASGNFVATWESFETDGSGIGVYAQRFNSDGTANGNAVQVNITTAGNQSRPTIGTDGNGHVVIAWQSEDAAGGNYDIFYTTGDFGGGSTTWLNASETKVNVVTTGSQTVPTVAMDAKGQFAIAWQSDQDSATNGFDVYSRYGTYGSGLLGSADTAVAVGTGDQVNPDAAMAVQDPAAATGSGKLVVAWTGPVPTVGTDEPTNVVRGTQYAYTYDSTTFNTPVGLTGKIDIQLTAAAQHDQVSPDVSMAPDGRFVLVWQAEGQQGSGSDIFSRRFDVNGDGIDATDVIVNTTTAEPQRSPVVAMDLAGNYFVLWQSQGADARSWGVVGRAFNADGTQARADFIVNVNEQGPQTLPAVAVSQNDAFAQSVAVWTGPFVPTHGGEEGEEGVEGEGGHQPGVFARRFRAAGAADVTPSTLALNKNGLEFQLATVGAGEDTPSSTVALSDGSYMVVWQSFEETLDVSGYGIYGQKIGADGALVGSKFLINQTTLGYQSHPTVAALAGGGFAVAWQSEVRGATPTDPSNYDIFARVFTSDGAGGFTGGTEFLVNSNTQTGEQSHPQAASDGASRLVVVWQTDAQALDEYGSEIYARRYSVSGATATPVASEFRVNTITAATTTPTVTGQDQVSPVIAMNKAGQFAIAWVSDHNVANDATDTEKSIFFRWFDANGVAPQAEKLANVYTKDAQENPAIGINEVGTVTLAWQSINQETGGTGVSWGVFARQFFKNGASPQSQEFQVNQTTSGPQRFASVSVTPRGYFNIGWQSINQDGSSWGVYQRQFNPEGGSETNETILNTVTSGPQILPVFARKPNGDYLAVWQGTAADHVDGLSGRIFNYSETDPNGDYVRDLYHDLLDRDVEPVALASWRSFVASAGRTATATSIWGSLEHRGIQVEQFYQTVLDRAADPAGKSAWVSALRSGWTEEQVLTAFLSSAEHQAQHPGLSAYIAELYDDVLERAPTTDELNAWVAAGATMTPSTLASGFVHGAENNQQTVSDYYYLFLERAPDPVGLKNWTDAMNSNQFTEEQVAISFLSSQEYFDKE